jgi:hypothetical protein
MTPKHRELLDKVTAGLEWHGGYLTLEDLIDLARERRVQIWANDSAIAATEILAYPRKRVVNAIVAAGDVRGVLALEPQIEAFARSENADAMVTHGRPGWGRIGQRTGWTAHSMLFVRRLGRSNGGAH